MEVISGSVNPVRDFRRVPSWTFGTVKFESQDGGLVPPSVEPSKD